MRRRHARPGPAPKPLEERRSLLVGVKVSAREMAAFQAAAAGLPVATWMRQRAAEAIEARGTRERLDAHLAQARVLSDRALRTLGEIDRKIEERIALLDRLVERAGREAGRGRGTPARRAGAPRDGRT